MNKDKIHKSFKKNDLETSKLILCKLIKHYSYDSIVEYLLNPNKINNPKLELIMKRLINKIGVDTLAFLLCNDNLNSNNLYNEKEEEEKAFIKYNYENENEKAKLKASIKKIKKKYRNKINSNKDNSKIDFYKYNKFKYKDSNNKYKFKKNFFSNEKKYNNFFNSFNSNSYSYSSSNDSNEMSEESEIDENNNSSNNNSIILKSFTSNNSYEYSEFCDSNINNEDIIRIVNEMEEEDNEKEIQKEEKKEIILDETNSYVNNIIYKEPNSGELYYYCFESINPDNTINMKCIDELCKSKGIYNPFNKQIIILVQHTIIYEEHCYLKPNFGGEELNLEIFDFIKDSPEIKGIEILKSKDNFGKKKFKGIKIKGNEGIQDNKEDNLKEKKENINQIKNINDKNIIDNNIFNGDNLLKKYNEKEEKYEPIFQNRITNNINQIIKNKINEKKNINKEKSNKDNYTLINLNLKNNNNSKNSKKNNYDHTRSRSRTSNINFISKDQIKLIGSNEIYKKENLINKTNKTIKEETEKKKEGNRNDKININKVLEKEQIKDKMKIEKIIENKSSDKINDIIKESKKNKNNEVIQNGEIINNEKINKNVEIKTNKNNEYDIIKNIVITKNNDIIKDDHITNNDVILKTNEIFDKTIINNPINKESQNKIDEKNKKEEIREENTSNKKNLNNSESLNKKDNLDISYNYIEFNIDNIKKFEGTEKSYSKKVNEINEQNKIKVEQDRKSKSKRISRKSEETNKENYYERHKSRSRSRSPSYLIINENDDEYSEYSDSPISKLSVISHFKNQKEEKIIIEENDSFFSLDLLSEKDREKFNKRINDETIFLSDDSEKRKRIERIQRKYQERNLKKYFKKNKFKKLFFKVNPNIFLTFIINIDI
jgi:hypothetical protein